MIAKINGILAELDGENHLLILAAGHIGYEVMIPGYAIHEFGNKVGREITLFCLEYYEGSAAGGNLIPRLIGFPQQRDKLFFQKFITVKGIGIRKALRALDRPIKDIAACIEAGDAKGLTQLPEIGKRSAEQIIAELNGKLTDFAIGGQTTGSKSFGPPKSTLTGIEREALEILIQLGEKREIAEEMIQKAMSQIEGIQSTDALIQGVYRVKGGII